MAFAGRCTITPQTGQVPSSQSNFAVLISVTSNNLKTVGNGGQVQNSNGYDIRAFSDAALTTALKFYRSFYDGTNGVLRMWIKIPTLAANSPYYIGFGDSSLNTDANDGPNTFSNGYTAVWPFEDGSTLNVNDITDGEFNGTNNGCTAATDILSAGASFDGTDDYIKIAGITPGSRLTFSCMIRSTSLSATRVIVARRPSMTGESGGNEVFLVYTTSAGKIQFAVNTGVTGGSLTISITGATALSTNTTYVVHGRLGASTTKIYLNGVEDATTASGGSLFSDGTTTPMHFGDDGTSGRFWPGTQRNCIISFDEKSADWIATEANSWIAPSTFATYVFDAAPGGLARSQAVIIG